MTNKIETIEFNKAINTTEVDKELGYAVKRAKVLQISDIEQLDYTLQNKANVVHTHDTNDIIGLDDLFDDKADKVHSHNISDVFNLRDELDTKENIVADPTSNDQLRKYDIDGSIEYIDIPSGGGGDAVWGSITGDIDNQTDLQQQFDTKSDTGHDHDGEYADIVHTHTISDVTNLQTELDSKASLSHGHEISDVNGLQDNLDAKMDDGDAYLKSEFINSSVGQTDANKPILLNSSGVIDDSMINVSGFYPVGDFTPTAGTEYPDTSSENPGALWTVEGVDDSLGYTFTGGDLSGDTAFNGDRMIYGSTSWILDRKVGFDEDLFYKRDGSQPITDHFAGGGFQLKDLADGTELQDAATINQIASFAGGFVKTDGTSIMTGNFNFGGMKGTNSSSGSVTGDVVEYDQFTSAINGRAPVDHDHIISDITDLQTELDSKALESDLTSHTGNTANPHSVTSAQVGLGYVIDTGDGSQYLTDDGTYKTVTGGVTDHNSLTGRDVADGHPISAITDLETELNSKADSSHEHTYSEITDFDDGVNANSKVSIAVVSDISVDTGSEAVLNMVVMTQAEYDAITPVATTVYLIVG